MSRADEAEAVAAVASRWDEHAHGSSFTLRVSGLADTLGVLGTIHRDRSHSIVDLLEQGGNPSAIMRSTTGQIRGDDLASARGGAGREAKQEQGART